MESESPIRKRGENEAQNDFSGFNRFFLIFSFFTFILGLAGGTLLLPIIGVEVFPQLLKMSVQQILEIQRWIGVIFLFLAIPVAIVVNRAIKSPKSE